MSEENKKCCGSPLKKLFVSIIALAVVAWGGWFGYAKATGRTDC